MTFSRSGHASGAGDARRSGRTSPLLILLLVLLVGVLLYFLGSRRRVNVASTTTPVTASGTRPLVPGGAVGVADTTVASVDPGALNAHPPVLPNASLTPGDTLPVTAQDICVSGYSRRVRNVPEAVKHQAYDSYGIAQRARGEFEVDHLISLELGGSNSIRNLWPQSYMSHPWNAHVKDVLENRLHEAVCSGRISLHDAQRAIAGNWVAAYRHYVGTLPTTPGQAP